MVRILSLRKTCPRESTVNDAMVPARRHVRIAQTPGAKPADISASIVNPARLNTKLQMDVCMQCHLEPTSGRLPSLIRKFNREPFSYVPGQPLEDFILYFDYPPALDTMTSLKSQAQHIGCASPAAFWKAKAR